MLMDSKDTIYCKSLFDCGKTDHNQKSSIDGNGLIVDLKGLVATTILMAVTRKISTKITTFIKRFKAQFIQFTSLIAERYNP